MAIAIDASSPAGVGTSGSSISTASFTPPSGALLVAVATAAVDTSQTATSPFVRVTDSLSTTWTDKTTTETFRTRGVYCKIWIADSNGSARTVTAAGVTGPTSITLQVYVVTGAAVVASQSGTVSIYNSTSFVAPTITMTPTSVGSLLVGGTPNHNELTTSGDANTTVDLNIVWPAGGDGLAFHQTALTASTSSTSYGLSTGVQDWRPIGLEIVPAGGGGGGATAIPDVIMAPMRGR